MRHGIIIIAVLIQSCIPPRPTVSNSSSTVSNNGSSKEKTCGNLLYDAAQFYVDSDWDNASRTYQNAVDIGCPGNDTSQITKNEILLYLAVAYQCQDELDSVVVVLKSGLQNSPGNTLFYKRLAFIYKRQKRYNELVALYEELHGQIPSDEEVLQNLAMLYKDLNLYDDQISALQKLLAINPENRAAIGDLIKAYDYIGRDIEQLKEMGINLPDEKIFETLGFSRDFILGPPLPEPPPVQKEPVVKYIPYDEPPKPIGGYAAIQRNIIYPQVAQVSGLQGTVIVQAFINKNGEVEHTVILKGLPKTGLDKAAMDAMKKTEFKPATRDGIPLGVWISVPVNFKLRN